MRTLRGLVSRRYTIAFLPKALRLSSEVNVGRDGRTSQFEWGFEKPDTSLTDELRRCTADEMPDAENLGPLRELLTRGFSVVSFQAATASRCRTCRSPGWG